MAPAVHAARAGDEVGHRGVVSLLAAAERGPQRRLLQPDELLRARLPTQPTTAKPQHENVGQEESRKSQYTGQDRAGSVLIERQQPQRR